MLFIAPLYHVLQQPFTSKWNHMMSTYLPLHSLWNLKRNHKAFAALLCAFYFSHAAKLIIYVPFILFTLLFSWCLGLHFFPLCVNSVLNMSCALHLMCIIFMKKIGSTARPQERTGLTTNTRVGSKLTRRWRGLKRNWISLRNLKRHFYNLFC